MHTEWRANAIGDLKGSLERRVVNLGSPLEFRSAANGETVTLAGWGSITENWYDIGDPKRGGFAEMIRRGAFLRTIAEGCDCVLNVLHSGLPYARTTTGSLRLSEDDLGLRFEADLQLADPDVAALLPKLQRGDLDGASMAFRVTDDSWDERDGQSFRTIRSLTLSKGDVSLVPYGANPLASVSLTQPATRSRSAGRPGHLDSGLRSRRDRERLALLRHGVPLTPAAAARPSIDDSDAYYRQRVAELRSRA